MYVYTCVHIIFATIMAKVYMESSLSGIYIHKIKSLIVSKIHNKKVEIRFCNGGFYSVQNVARSTLSERFLFKYKQSSGTNSLAVFEFTHFKNPP